MLLLPLNPHTGHLYLHSNSELCWPSSQQTIHYFTLQVTRAKCLIFRSATHWLYSFLWDWAEPGSPLEQLLWSSPKPAGSWAWTIPALSQPPPELLRSAGPPWVHNLSTVGSYCPCIPLKALDCQVSSSHLKFLIRLCAFLLSWVPAEDFWLQSSQDKNCSLCSSMDKVIQYPSWAAERILFSALSELLLSLVSFFLTMP